MGSRKGSTLGWSDTEPLRKWTVWIRGKRSGEVLAFDEPTARERAQVRWRIPAEAVRVKLKFPTARDLGPLGESSAELVPSTPEDAQVIKVALTLLGWSRERLGAQLPRVKSSDVASLLQGRGDGWVKAQAFQLLSEAGCDLEGIRTMLIRITERSRERATRNEPAKAHTAPE